MTNKIKMIFNYGQSALNRVKHADFDNRYCDMLDEGINKTNDFINNLQLGRDLIQLRHNSTRVGAEFETNYDSMVNTILDEHLDKFELTKDLSKSEKNKLFENLPGDRRSFVTFLLDGKPSILISGKNNFLKSNDTYDVLLKKDKIKLENNKTATFNNTMILNKELTKKTIEKYKDIYTTRMGLKNDVSVDEIYSALISDESPLLKKGNHDLMGITLGFSPVNSIIFQLESSIPNKLECRENLNEYKKNLLNILFSEDSPYKDFNENFKSNIAAKIRDIGKERQPFINKWGAFGYTYLSMVPDKEYEQELIKNINICYQKSKTLQ